MREITPLTPGDCFTIFSQVKKEFNSSLHYHDEYELHLIINAKGARRVVGGHIDVIDDLELVFIGPNLYHAWFTHECQSEEITEIIIQFHKDLFDEKFLKRNQLNLLKNMLDRSQRGIVFSEEIIRALMGRLQNLDKKNGFDSVLELLSILHDLSLSRNIETLSEPGFTNGSFNCNSRRIERVFEYMNLNYHKQISLARVAEIANMSEGAFSRFIKKSTGKTFTDSLNEIRLGHVSRMLIDSTATIAEIAYKCGFNNISYFNRVFKSKKLCIPSEFRETYTGNRIFV